MLKNRKVRDVLEAGCDEAGRGCLAGPVYAAAVILPEDFSNELLNDSKALRPEVRYHLRAVIEQEALAWAVSRIDNEKIDELNILRASILAMHMALDQLSVKPEHIIVDGNKFYSYKGIPHDCIVKGDARFSSIAAASVLAKTWRDDYMNSLHEEFTQYGWNRNKGYPTAYHRAAIARHGITPYHRRSFTLTYNQLKLNI